ncbi:MAG: tetratricopeptide repeat protein [Sphaerochaeta sp.]|nr:tetratricopeptide repeat protein [Sphaerochaeta sp.]
MENYLSRLLLTSELDDPVYFAQVHQNIMELEKKRVEHFNLHGPANSHYVTLMGELNMAYLHANDPTNELAMAKQIFETTKNLYGKDDEITLEAEIALANSYLDDGQDKQAQTIATGLLKRDWTTEEGPSYDLYMDTICLQADIYHSKELYIKELPLRKHVMGIYEEFEGSADHQTIMARVALAYCLEKMKRYREALGHYIVVRAFLDADKHFSTEAERIGLMAHIAHCYHRMGRIEEARIAYQWVLNEALERYGHGSPLTTKVKRITKNFFTQEQNSQA